MQTFPCGDAAQLTMTVRGTEYKVCERVLRKGSMNFKMRNILRHPPPDNEGGMRREREQVREE